MELVFVYVEEHKILQDIGVSTHPNFDVTMKNGSLSISYLGKDFDYYYNGVKIRAIIGKNGTGKSTLLDFIEISFTDTESRGFNIWYEPLNDEFLIQPVNFDFSTLNLNLCLKYKVLQVDRQTLKKLNHIIAKVNNLNATTKQHRISNVIDLSLGKQGKLTGKSKNANLANLIEFFNESSWISKKGIQYKYTFNFKSPSTTVKKWLFDIYCEKNSDIPKNQQKHKFMHIHEAIFFPEPLFQFGEDEFNRNEFERIFNGIFWRNIFSLIKALPTTRIVNSDFANILAYEIINLLDDSPAPEPSLIIKKCERIFIKWSQGKDRKSSTIQGVDIQIFKKYFDRNIHIFHQLAMELTRYSVSLGNDSSELVTSEFSLISNLLNIANSIPKQIINNFSYGWEGLSTGELARLNVFSSIYRQLQSSQNSSHLFIIDEVDLYLHPEWQRTFMDEFISFLADEAINHKVQLLITTHSPLIIGDFLPNDIISLQLDKYGRPYVGESFGFGTEITDAYISGMHISSTFGELSRKHLLRLIDKKSKKILGKEDLKLISQLKESSFKRMLLND